MERKKTINIIIFSILVIIIIIVSMTINSYIIDNGNNQAPLVSPLAQMNFITGEGGYEINITDIEYAPRMDKWLKLEKIYFLLSPRPLPAYGDEHFPLGDEGGTTEEYFRALIDDTDNPYNLASGRLIDIINTTNGNVIYQDMNEDLMLSIDDKILIDYSLISRNLTSEEYILDLIYIGDLEGELSREILDFIGYIIIKKSD